MTNWHPTEDDLILHFYGEGRENEGRVDDHVHACPQCQEVWDDLTETLKMVDAAQVPEPDSGFERVMWARGLPRAAGSSSGVGLVGAAVAAGDRAGGGGDCDHRRRLHVVGASGGDYAGAAEAGRGDDADAADGIRRRLTQGRANASC
jgi:hypothetical protein